MNEQERIQTRMRLWGEAIDRGWEIGPHNCLVGVYKKVNVRLNFRDGSVLRFEKKVPLSKEERAKEPLRSTRWVCTRSAGYEKVAVLGTRLGFKEKRGEGKVKKEKRHG